MRAFWAFLLVLTGVALGAAAWGWYDYSRPGPLDEPRTVFIQEGTGAQGIARELSAAGIIRYPWTFLAAVRATDRHGLLRAGEYAFPSGISVRAAIDKLVAGDVVIRRVTIAEGLTTREALRIVEQAEGLTGPVPEAEEGSLLPDTYHFSRGDSRESLVARMQRAMTSARERVWADRVEGLPISSPDELVTLASIVERETGVAEERTRVAAVFVNRLRKGMPLQSDPTVVYAIERAGTPLGRPLLRADLTVDDPYNTYGNHGLPPGPIANPGLASMQAVANPAETDEFYFVADGTGGHAFARTLAEHNRNVQRWREIQRKARSAQP